MTQSLIQQHGLIGNMKTSALVDSAGAIDFFCFPDFDSPSVFLSLLDDDKGGKFEILPQMAEMRTRQIYLSGTNILVTRFMSSSAVAEVTDFMPVREEASGEPNRPDEPNRLSRTSQPSHANQIVRCIRVIKGEVQFRVRCSPRFDYARSGHTATLGNQCISFRPEDGQIVPMTLRASVVLSVEDGDGIADFSLGCGQAATFALDSTEASDGVFGNEQFDQLFSETSRFWAQWISQSEYQGRWRETVNRSVLVLKLLSSRETGALIAAPTFGLPERIGGARNWDYRLSWLRDSSFTLYAFMRLGFTQEVRNFGGWMRERIENGLKEAGQNGPLKPMYHIRYEGNQPEIELEHLTGYRNSRPVRIGNAAESQLQLDIYGELMDAVYLGSKYVAWMSNDGWKRMTELLNWLQENWKRPDEGIWEVRNGQQQFLHSKLMCWVAFDRLIRLAQKRSLVAPLDSWLKTRDEIHEDIFDNFWNEKLNSFVQAEGSDTLDASVLLMPLMRFISPTDPRWLSTMGAIEEHLTEGGLVYRYASGTDGLDGHEGGFLPCSFWFIECLARSGQVEKAQFLFDRMLSYGNHLGLYSEELGSNGEQLGNFPQALTHLALVSAAHYLNKALSGEKGDTWQ